jgi:hypothetical protein
MKFKYYFFLATLVFLLSNCSGKEKDQGIAKKKIFEPNVQKRAEAYRDSSGGILGDFKKQNNSGNFEFATSNVLWRATLETLDFIPLQSVSYSGGTLITDWYGNNKESIKIQVNFKSSTLETSSLEVKSFKKTCKNESNCAVAANNSDFNINIKNKILSKARKLNINSKKNKKK